MTDARKIVRVRTGCITCRKRRTKCDEGRPSCDRCRAANFLCEGYSGPQVVRSGRARPRRTSNASRKVQSSPRSGSSSPRSDTPPSDMVEELPWRQTNWRRDQLPLYHHFVTSTVKRLFPVEHMSFWRDRVAQMSFGADAVYEALLAVGAAHRAALLCGSGSGVDMRERKTLQVQGFRAYGNAIKSLATNLQAQQDVQVETETVLVVLLLCTCFECFMESPKAALRHLYAAIQIFRRFETQFDPAELAKLKPVIDLISRFDFLAMKLVPYAASSFPRSPTLLLSDIPSRPSQPSDFPLSIPLSGRDLSINSATVTTERLSLIQVVSSHAKLTKVVWGAWYPVSERPSRDALHSFCTDLSSWKDTSSETFASHISDPDSLFASTLAEVARLPVPPQPLEFTSAEAAVSMIMYNGFLGCALAAISTNDPDPLAREIESYNSVYQIMRISSGLLSEWTRRDLDDHGYRPCDSLDMGISMFLYHGGRRCFSPSWQQWIVTALHSIGREGLLNAHAFANTLEIMTPLQRVVPQILFPENGVVATTSPLGHLSDRLAPVVLPMGEKGEFVAYFLRYGVTENDSDENFIRVVGVASWRQDCTGNMLELQTEATSKKITSGHVQEKIYSFASWREKAEVGWHGLI